MLLNYDCYNQFNNVAGKEISQYDSRTYVPIKKQENKITANT